MEAKTKEIYSEVYGVLQMLGEKYIKKLPNSLFNLINEKRDKNYMPKYEKTIELDKQPIKRETISMIALFHLNYWCKTNDEKEKLKVLFKENENKYQLELRKKYNPDNLFKNKEKDNVKIQEDVAIIEYKETLFKRLLNKIKDFFKIK